MYIAGILNAFAPGYGAVQTVHPDLQEKLAGLFVKINDITDATIPDKKPARATVVIGDTHYFKERPAKKGETYNISVWGVDSHALVGLEVRHNNVENLTYKHVTNPDYTVVRFAEEVTE